MHFGINVSAMSAKKGNFSAMTVPKPLLKPERREKYGGGKERYVLHELPPLSSFGAYLPRYTVIPLTSDRPADRVNNSTNPPFSPVLCKHVLYRGSTDTYTKEKGGKEKEGSGGGSNDGLVSSVTNQAAAREIGAV